jgi:hypothetical protein
MKVPPLCFILPQEIEIFNGSMIEKSIPLNLRTHLDLNPSFYVSFGTFLHGNTLSAACRLVLRCLADLMAKLDGVCKKLTIELYSSGFVLQFKSKHESNNEEEKKGKVESAISLRR